MPLRSWMAALLVCVGLWVAACTPRTSAVPGPVAPLAVSDALGPGDVLEVRVHGQEDLEGTYQINADGKIRFPYIGEVAVAGHGAQQVGVTIQERLADGWLRDPHVSVVVVSRHNREVSVLGQVNEPGSIEFKERLSLVQAVSLAGGMTPLAQPRKVRITRQTGASRETLEIDLRAIIDGRRADLLLRPGDVVFVPESAI